MASRAKVAARRKKVAQLFLRGWHQTDIAEKFGVTQGRISQDLKAIKQAWKERTSIDLDEHLSHELAKINETESEFWRGWNRSLRDKKEKIIKAAGKTAKPGKVEKIWKITGQAGDPRFLDGVIKCIERRCKLLDPDAPQKHKVEVTQRLTNDERRKRLTWLLERNGGFGSTFEKS